MRWIRKGEPPRSLLEYKQQVGATYKEMDKAIRAELLSSLIKEQGGVCAYCQRYFRPGMGRITIEHHCEQSNDDCNGVTGPDRTMDYQNLLAVCDGKNGLYGDLTCDSRKAQIKWKEGEKMEVNPLVENHAQWIKYSGSGRISSDNGLHNREIEEVLNLNAKHLRDLRRDEYSFIWKAATHNRRMRNLGGKPNFDKMKKVLLGKLEMKTIDLGTLQDDLAGNDASLYKNSFPGLYEYLLQQHCS